MDSRLRGNDDERRRARSGRVEIDKAPIREFIEPQKRNFSIEKAASAR